MELAMNMNENLSKYSIEEIEAAQKRQKKKGGSFMENLEAIAPGRQNKKPSMDFSQLPNTNMKAPTSSPVSAPASAKGSVMTAGEVGESIRELEENLAKDFGTVSPKTLQNSSSLSKFSGLSEVLSEKIIGQQDFLKHLIIAFKRPLVSERDENDALNSIYITGPTCTGKHFALQTLVTELANRRLLPNNEIATLNLSLYPSVGEEKLFLQDLYACLQSKAHVLVFEHFESCHISLLNRLSELVITGECRLTERYLLQNGQLIQVANALAGNTIGAFEAKGKYLIFLSDKPVNKLAGIMGAPFVNALGDICETSDLDAEALKTISSMEETTFLQKCKKQLGYEVTVEESFRQYLISQAQGKRGLRGILDGYEQTKKALSELRLESEELTNNTILLKLDGDIPVIAQEDKTLPLSQYLSTGYNGELEAVKKELDSIVGLKEVKEYILRLEEYYAVQRRRREAGLKAGEVNKHMIFTGNPGTGKTTIARIVSKYLKAIGVLSGGQLVEVSRADLVGRYVGHTAPLVNQVIKSALGGVLFIDEAYSLHRGGEDNFGLEAIDTLVKGIEDNRDDLVVILAGYSNEMEEFLESNSGLKSRFPNIIDFPDYTGEELLSIAELTAKQKGYELDEGCKQPLLDYFNQIQATRAMDAGNGRLVRNKLEEAILNQSKRLVAMPDASLTLLTEMDFDLNDI